MDLDNTQSVPVPVIDDMDELLDPEVGQKRKRDDDDVGDQPSREFYSPSASPMSPPQTGAEHDFYNKVILHEADVSEPEAQSSDEDVEDIANQSDNEFIDNEVIIEDDGEEKIQRVRPQWKKRPKQLTRDEKAMVFEHLGIDRPVGFDLDQDVEHEQLQTNKGSKFKLMQEDPEDDLGLNLEHVPQQMDEESVGIFEDQRSIVTDQHISPAPQSDIGFVEYDGTEEPPPEGTGASVIESIFGPLEELIGMQDIQPGVQEAPKPLAKPAVAFDPYFGPLTDDEEQAEAPKPKPRAVLPKKKRKTKADIRREEVLSTDTPERLVNRIKNTTPEQLEEDVLKKEVKWIMKNGFGIYGHRSNTRDFYFEEKDIEQVIKWIRQKEDIPYIFYQHRDYLPSHRYYRDNERELKKHLWIIDEYDEKWQKLYLRKQELLKMFQKCQQNNEQIDFELEEKIRYCDTQEELKDIHGTLNAYGAAEEKQQIEIPECPVVTKNEAIGFDIVRIGDGFERIQDNILNIQNKIEDNASNVHLEVQRRGRTEVQNLLDFYRQQQASVMEDTFGDMDMPEVTTEAAQEFEGCSLADEADLEAFFQQMENKIKQIDAEMEVSVVYRKEVEEELTLLMEYYQKLLELCQNKQFSGLQLKRPKKSSRNHNVDYRDLKPLVDMVGDIKQLGFYLKRTSESAWRNTAPVNDKTVEEALIEFLPKSRYSTAKALKKALIHVMARRIGLEPTIRQQVRDTVFNKVTVSTEPTHEGKLRINWMHPFACVKRLESKPFKEFAVPGCKQWIYIEEALKSSLLKPPKYDMPESKFRRFAPPDGKEISPIVKYYMNEMVERFCTTGRSQGGTSPGWDELRGSVLRESLTMYLQPLALKYCRKKLTEHAHKTIIREASNKLWNLGTYGYVNCEATAHSDERTIVACVVGGHQEPTFCAVLDHRGAVLKHLLLHFLKCNVSKGSGGSRDPSQRGLMQRKHIDTKQFKNFIRTHKPILIAIDGSNIQCDYFIREVEQALTGIGPDATCEIRLVEPCVSRVFRTSSMASEELESYPLGLRQAVSLGRFCLNPVSELCRLWNIDKINNINHILTLPLHTEMRLVPADKLLYGLRQVLYQLVSDAGVNVNHLLKREYLRPALQFVCGMGPIRANEFIENLTMGGYIMSRTELLKPEGMDVEGEENQNVESHGLLPSQIYKNAIMFLRVEKAHDMIHYGEEEQMVYLLDGSLIHPDDYEYAELVISNALDQEPDDCEIQGVDEETQRAHKVKTFNGFLHKIRVEDPGSIESLNLELFAERHEQGGGVRILYKLNHIKKETKEHYTVSRKPLTNLNEDKNVDYLFELLTGESNRTLSVGQKLTCKVSKVKWAGVKCTLLDNGLDCWLPASKISREITDKIDRLDQKYMNEEPHKDEHRKQLQSVLKNIVEEGEHIEARIVEIDKKKRSVKLSLLHKDMKNTDGLYETPKEKCRWLNINHPDDDPNKAIEDERKRDGPKQPFIPRQIDFEYFKNISREEAEKQLASQEAGSIIIRPSSHGLDHLSLTWKMTAEPDIFVHYMIKELDKPNRYALGRKLEIERETYDELDELVAEFVDKLNEMKNDITSHDRFRFGPEEDIDEELMDDKREKPFINPYALSYSYHHPGRFLLSYIPRQSVHKEYISLTLKGFRFRKVYFTSPSQLINWFKKHPQKYPAKNNNKKRSKNRRDRDRRRHRNHSSSSSSPQNSSFMEDSSQSYMSYDSSSPSGRY